MKRGQNQTENQIIFPLFVFISSRMRACRTKKKNLFFLFLYFCFLLLLLSLFFFSFFLFLYNSNPNCASIFFRAAAVGSSGVDHRVRDFILQASGRHKHTHTHRTRYIENFVYCLRTKLKATSLYGLSKEPEGAD